MTIQILGDETEDDERSFPITTRGNPFTHNDSVVGLVRRGLSSLEEHTRDGRIYASQAAVCVRQSALTSTHSGSEVQSPANTTYYALGNAIEELVMSALTRERSLLFTQYKLPDVGLNMGGYIDGIIHVGGRVKVLEVKSCGDLPSSPKLEHRAQAMVYSAITGLSPVLLYFSRKVAGFDGTLMVREFSLTPSHEEVVAILFKVAYARESIDMGVIPDKPYEFVKESQCGFCPWKDICWRGAELPRPLVTPEQHVELVRLASERVAKLTSPEAIEHRRHGVLQHVQRYGTADAKKLLAGDWTTLISGDLRPD